MINLSDLGQAYIVCGKTDLHKGIDRHDFIFTSISLSHTID